MSDNFFFQITTENGSVIYLKNMAQLQDFLEVHFNVDVDQEDMESLDIKRCHFSDPHDHLDVWR